MTIKIQIQKEKLVFLGGGRKGAFKTNFVKGINSLAPPPTIYIFDYDIYEITIIRRIFCIAIFNYIVYYI